MGQYYVIANFDKKEYIAPHDLDCGAKLMETCYSVIEDGNLYSNGYVATFVHLLKGRWKNDKVAVIGDYADINFAYDNDFKASMPEACAFVNSLYENIGELSNDSVGSQFSNILDYIESNFKKLTKLKDKNYHDKPIPRYLINTKRKEYYDLEKMPELDTLRIVPLTLLLAIGNGLGGGDYRTEDCPGLKNSIGSWTTTSEFIRFADELNFNIE